jgi:hypothetical protein
LQRSWHDKSLVRNGHFICQIIFSWEKHRKSMRTAVDKIKTEKGIKNPGKIPGFLFKQSTRTDERH